MLFRLCFVSSLYVLTRDFAEGIPRRLSRAERKSFGNKKYHNCLVASTPTVVAQSTFWGRDNLFCTFLSGCVISNANERCIKRKPNPIFFQAKPFLADLHLNNSFNVAAQLRDDSTIQSVTVHYSSFFATLWHLVFVLLGRTSKSLDCKPARIEEGRNIEKTHGSHRLLKHITLEKEDKESTHTTPIAAVE